VSSVNGRRSLTEIKTSNAVHEDFLIQMACQKACWDETFPDKPIEEFHLLRLGKEAATFTHHYWRDLPGALEAFQALRKLHEIHPKLKKLL